MAHQDEGDFLMEHIPRSGEERTTGKNQKRSRVLSLVGFVFVAAFVVGKLSVFGSSEKSNVKSLLQLDDADLSQRKTALTAWVNEQLKKETNVHVEDLVEDDFTHGAKLLVLLQELSGEVVRTERGRDRYHWVSCISTALHFLQGKGACISGIDAEEVVDGNLKTTLDLVWAIIVRFAPKDAEEMQSEMQLDDADPWKQKLDGALSQQKPDDADLSQQKLDDADLSQQKLDDADLCQQKLDDADLDQRKDAFTAWVNEQLKEINVHVEDLGDDFTDGAKLVLLLQQVSGERVGKVERGRLRAHWVSAINMALRFLQSKGACISGIDAEEVVDGNLKTTLDLVWRIIVRFAPKDAEEMQSEST